MFMQYRFLSLLAGLIMLLLTTTSFASDSNFSNVIQIGGSVEALHERSFTDAEIAFQLLFNELLAEIDAQVKIKIYEDHSLFIDKFEDGDLHAIFLSSIDFFDLDDLIHSSARYAVQFGDTLKQRSLVLVNRNTKQPSLESLQNGKFCYSAGHQIGRRFLDVSLLEQGLPHSDQFFKQIIEVKDANTAIMDLYFKKVDVVVVPEHSYRVALELNPQIDKSIKVITRSEPMIYQIIGVRWDFPQWKIDKIEPYILSTNRTPRMQQIYKTYRMSQIHRATEETLKETKELNERYLTLLGKNR